MGVGLSYWLATEWETSPMSHVKQASKRKSRTKAVTVLGVAGAFSLASGASGAAVSPAGDARVKNTPPPAIAFGEEEISDVSRRLSMSSTTKTPEHVIPAYNLPRGRAATEAVRSTEAAEAAQ
jgi:hypothetical protein